MDRFAVRSITILVFGTGLFTLGCEDPSKARIAQLEGDLAKTAKDLAAAQDELAKNLADRQKLENDLAFLRQQNADLQAKATQKPNVPEGWSAVPGGAMTSIPGSLLFDSGKAILRAGSMSTLDKVIATVKERFPGKDIYVFGHTDTEPIHKSTWKDNYELSCQRSLSVVRYLAKKGISQSQLVACGWGEHKPVSPNSTSAAKQKNRRVEIYAVDLGGGVPEKAEAKAKATPE
jgi:chemotaxis protein MotB